MAKLSRCASLMVLALTAGAVFAAPPPGQTWQPVLAPGEKALMEKSRQLAKPLDLTRFAGILRPRVVDYSNLVTYVRCQTNGCMTYAVLSAADIINEFQAPYTPDLSWQYALRTWDETFNAALAQNPQAPGPDLNATFNPGVSSEGLCRSESDYLTLVPTPQPRPIKDNRLYFDPPPSAEAKAEAQLYKFKVSDGITPDVETLKTLLLTYGPVWADGGWWWNGAHAMCFTGYDDNTSQFSGVNSGGDWRDNHGFWKIPYDKLTQYVGSLRTVEMIPTPRYQGRWAYSSRLRIHGNWRGTWTVNIGVQGRVPQTVYRSYGRVPDLPAAHGELLDLDVPLPDYAAQYWPPRANAKWYLQVEDNDRDGRTGTVLEWILARHYEDPNCGSVDHWKTQTYKHSANVPVPDATGQPDVTASPPAWVQPPPTRNSNPGKAMLYLPETDTGGIVAQTMILQPRITLDPTKCVSSGTGDSTLAGRLTAGPSNAGLAAKTVELCQLKPDDNVNKPASWVRLTSAKTDAQGNYAINFKLPPLGQQVLGIAYRGADGLALCSTKPLVRSVNSTQWIQETRPVDVLMPRLPRPGDVMRPQPARPLH